jgi:hypothetical protein
MAVVYEHIRNDTNEVFYVGIGEEEGRAYVRYGRNPHWKNIVNKSGYTVNIIHKDIDWEEAKKIEILLIEKYGRKNLGLGNLVNMTDGGEGSLGVVVSEETRQNMSEAQKGRTFSEEAKQKMSKALKGRTFSEEAKQKMSEAKKGGKNPNFGKPRSEETKQNMSEAHRNRKGVKGYYFDKTSKTYISRILVGVNRIKIGTFDTPEEASQAYQQARLIYFV